MPKWTCDEDESDKLFDALNRYMQSNVLEKDREILDEKFRQHGKNSNKELDIQLPYVGDFYDLKRDGNPFRILIFGSEPAVPGNWDMRCKKKITQKFNNKKCRPFDERGDHMSGTLFTLQRLFGVCPDKNDRQITINGEARGIFSAFALSNACLYRLEKKGSNQTDWGIAKTMIKNSQSHSEETIEKLKPQIVILQGQRAEYMADQAYKKWGKEERYTIIKSGEEIIVERVAKTPPKGIITAHIDKINLGLGCRETLFLSISHPTARGYLGYASRDKARKYLCRKISILLEMYEEIWNAPV